MKTITLASLVLFAALAVPGSAQVAKSGASARPLMPAASTVEMKVVDDKGQAIRPESLPKDVQANLDRVRKAAESLAAPGAPGEAAQRIKVTISCGYPPLKCTITVAF
jgi:hypothetical protein